MRLGARALKSLIFQRFGGRQGLGAGVAQQVAERGVRGRLHGDVEPPRQRRRGAVRRLEGLVERQSGGGDGKSFLGRFVKKSSSKGA